MRAFTRELTQRRQRGRQWGCHSNSSLRYFQYSRTALSRSKFKVWTNCLIIKLAWTGPKLREKSKSHGTSNCGIHWFHVVVSHRRAQKCIQMKNPTWGSTRRACRNHGFCVLNMRICDDCRCVCSLVFKADDLLGQEGKFITSIPPLNEFNFGGTLDIAK